MITNEAILEETRRTLALLRPAEGGVGKWLRENVTRPLLELLERVAGAIAGLAGSLGGTFLLVALVVAAVVLLLLLGHLLFRRGQARSRTLSADRVALRTPVLRDPDEADREAVDLARAGRFREAVRLLYLATFVRLHRRSGRPFDPALTPGENLRAFRGEPWFQGLRTFVGGYVGASFGDASLDDAGYRDLAALRPPEGGA